MLRLLLFTAVRFGIQGCELPNTRGPFLWVCHVEGKLMLAVYFEEKSGATAIFGG